MTARKRLMKLAIARWGGRWRAELAAAAGRDRRTVYRWVSGAQGMPEWVWSLFDQSASAVSGPKGDDRR